MCRIFASYVAVGSAGAAAEEGGYTGRRRHKIVTKILLHFYPPSLLLKLSVVTIERGE